MAAIMSLLVVADGFEQPLIVRAQSGVLQQVGSVGESLAQLLLAAPPPDLLVVAIEQHLRRSQAAEFSRAGVVGVIEKTARAMLRAGNAFHVRGDGGIDGAEAFELP